MMLLSTKTNRLRGILEPEKTLSKNLRGLKRRYSPKFCMRHLRLAEEQSREVAQGVRGGPPEHGGRRARRLDRFWRVFGGRQR